MPPRFVVAAVAVALAGCAETPADGFEAFFHALAQGSPDAYARLSTRAQRELDVVAAAHHTDGARYLTSTTPKATVRAIRVVDESAASADLEVTDALGKSARVHMVKEDARWRVDRE